MTEREWHEAKDMRPSFVGLGVVLLAAAVLRLWAIGHGIPYAPGVDEPEIMCRVVGMMKTGDFNPHFFDYPGLYLYTQLVVAVLRFLAGAMSGRWVSLSQVGPADFYLWGRVATAILGTITVYLVYQIGMRWGARHALLAAGLLAVMPNHVRESHYVLTDVPATFLCALAFLLSLRAQEKSSIGAFAWAGAAAGLAAATKYNAAVVLVIPLLAVYTTPGGRVPRVRTALAVVGACGLAYLIGAPYTVLDLPAFLNGFAYLASAYLARRPSSASSAWLVYLKHLRLGLGWPGLILAFAGLGLGLWRMTRGPWHARFALLVIFPLVYFWMIATKGLIYARYLLPIVPSVCLLAAIAVVSGVSLLRRFDIPRAVRTALIAGLTVAALLPPTITAVRFDARIGRKSTYSVAYEWISGNLPRGTRVAIETGSFRLPDESYPVIQLKRLIDRDLQAYRADGVQYLVASSQAYGPAFSTPQVYPDVFNAYHQLFNQLVEVKRVPQFPDAARGPELRIFKVPQ